MGTASLRFDAWSMAWHTLRRKLAVDRDRAGCAHARWLWNPLTGRTRRILLKGASYCLDRCLESALASALDALSRAAPRPAVRHRIPLGLILISREQLTAAELQMALAAQRAAGHGRIGEWLRTLGLATEQEVTAALARQWSCPVLRADSALRPGRAPRIPLALLQSFSMFAVDYVESTATLHLAFSEGVDYGVLHAIEQMLGCRTEACLALPSLLSPHLETLASARDENEVVFERVEDVAESARIIRSYAARISASEVRLISCGSQFWIRLLRSRSQPLDLLLRNPTDAGLQRTSTLRAESARTHLKSHRALPIENHSRVSDPAGFEIKFSQH